MEQIINWIIENKEWLFSGLGITIIAFVVKNSLRRTIEAKTNRHSRNLIAKHKM